eukprot:gnl/MRDRNA2_/MRDRNA2_59473_c0_seq1.p1 gnl/MRDRNA2_/MRDRNA2_59473_c0~~gnl/MRDRNA2_/MRDRNA2_59473_c0_seq1.p1  ORF type:complete len:350 (-),score=53.20 gnl/MRDRNA2_/MRDRNA2_59473_c0_seq1:385-1434(-)
MFDELGPALRLFTQQAAFHRISGNLDPCEMTGKGSAEGEDERLGWAHGDSSKGETEDDKENNDHKKEQKNDENETTESMSEEKEQPQRGASTDDVCGAPCPTLTRGESTRTSRSTTAMMTLHVHTIAGQEITMTIPQESCTEHLMIALENSMAVSVSHQILVFQANVLGPGLTLHEQGVVDRSTVTLVVRYSPERVRVQLKEKAGSSALWSLSGSCGTYVRTDTNKHDRPVYKRDRTLSEWNTKLLYWGAGDRFLMYEQHELGGRWVITDDSKWNAYQDQSYAYVFSEADHPGHLVNQLWVAFHNNGRVELRKWVPIDFLDVREEDAVDIDRGIAKKDKIEQVGANHYS